MVTLSDILPLENPLTETRSCAVVEHDASRVESKGLLVHYVDSCKKQCLMYFPYSMTVNLPHWLSKASNMARYTG